MPDLPALPEFTADPTQRLRHTVAAYRDEPDERPLLLATSSMSFGGDSTWTGLTAGDLRALLRRLDAVELHRPKLYDRYGRETADAEAATSAWCRECAVNTGPDGCRTWLLANA